MQRPHLFFSVIILSINALASASGQHSRILMNPRCSSTLAVALLAADIVFKIILALHMIYLSLCMVLCLVTACKLYQMGRRVGKMCNPHPR